MRINITTSFFLPVPPVAGGAMEKAWFRLAQEFARTGHQVTLLSRSWRGFPKCEMIEGVNILRVPGFSHSRSLPLNLLLDAVWALRLLRALPQAEVTACNNVSLPALLPRLRPRCGAVVAVLGRMPKGQIRFYGGVARLIATSDAVAARVAHENPKVVRKTRVIPNPMDWHLHAAASKQGKSPVTIGFMGRIHPEKGLEQLLDAAALIAGDRSLPDWRLRLRGPADVSRGGRGEAYQRELQTRYAALGPRVSWEPPVFDEASLAQHYGDLDIFCYPSLAAKGEGLSVAPLEAMAAGAVPVLSRLDCYRDVLREGVNGFTFDHTSANAARELADTLVMLIRSPSLRERMAARAKEDTRRFDYQAVAGQLLDDFAQLTR